SQYILNDHPDATHILLVDDFENRVQFMVDRYDMSRKKAERLVVSEDRRRVNLYKRLGKSDYENPLLYHLVLNMGRLDLETARDMVCQLVSRRLALSAA
ncbi:MAG TPA: cytidylate kinase family protein, partial [Desulfosarcina sp.]|nr:cytidylate kinase family protein [Desulfosarcina sp.]